MGLTNAERRWRRRERRDALARGNPELAERELVQAAKRCEGLPDEDRIALADKLADRAMTYLHRAQELAALARRVRGGEG